MQQNYQWQQIKQSKARTRKLKYDNSKGTDANSKFEKWIKLRNDMTRSQTECKSKYSKLSNVKKQPIKRQKGKAKTSKQSLQEWDTYHDDEKLYTVHKSVQQPKYMAREKPK
jgi:hypothetical protein